MAFFTGKTGSVVFDGNQVATMDSWSVTLEGERIDISDYNQLTFKSIVGLPIATVQMSGPWPYDLVLRGYFFRPGDEVNVVLNFDSLGIYHYAFKARIESGEVSSDVRGVMQCNISAVIIGDWYNGDASTEAMHI